MASYSYVIITAVALKWALKVLQSYLNLTLEKLLQACMALHIVLPQFGRLWE